MSTEVLAPSVAAARATERVAPPPIPMHRVMSVELRKMFNTRSGFWLMGSIVILATVATTATILFAPEDELTYEAFASAVGFPMAVILPIIAILSVTSEWSQRTSLTTFTLVPSRRRVIAAKASNTVLVGVGAMLVASAIGAVGNVVGTQIAGVETTWNLELQEFVMVTMATVIGMAIGFMLGVLLRNSPAAIVSYFVYSLVLPTASTALAAYQEGFRDNIGWIDFNYNVSQLYNHTFTGEYALSGEQWLHLGATGLVWLVIPLAIGLRLVLRSEVK